MEVWRNIGVWAMGIVGMLLCSAGIDCVWDGVRDARRREITGFQRETGAIVALTGGGLLIVGGLLLWGFYAWRR